MISRLFGPFGIGAVIRPADLGDDIVHFGIGPEDGAHLALDFLGLVQRGGRRQADGQPDIAFVQLGQEFAAQQGRQQQRHGQHADSGRHDALAPRLRPQQQVTIALLQAVHPVAVLFRQVLVLHRITQQGRHQRQRQQDRAEQRETSA